MAKRKKLPPARSHAELTRIRQTKVLIALGVIQVSFNALVMLHLLGAL